MERSRLQNVTDTVALCLGLTVIQPAHAANLTICDHAPTCGADAGSFVFKPSGFDYGFSVNGSQIQIGEGDGPPTSFSRTGGPANPFQGAAQISFTGSWLVGHKSPGDPEVTPQNETIFFLTDAHFGHQISAVLHYVYIPEPGIDWRTGRLDGWVASTDGAFDADLLHANGIDPTQSVLLQPEFFFSNLGITASYQSIFFQGSDVTPIPEPETYVLMMAGLGAVALVARRRRNSRASSPTSACGA